MKRIMLDTSVYGKLVFEEKVLSLLRKKYESHEFTIYGATIIRRELRETPKHVAHEKYKLRILLLSIYDSFIKKKNQSLKYNKLVAELANDYFKEYKKNKGSLSTETIANDLIIIATATIYQLDLVISDDERSMLSDKTVKAYNTVNRRYGLNNPTFKKYNKFKEELLR